MSGPGRDRFAALVEALRLGDTFQLLVVECGDGGDAAAVLAAIGAAAVDVATINPYARRASTRAPLEARVLAREVLDPLQRATAEKAWMIDASAALPIDTAAWIYVFHRLNEHRNALIEHLNATLIICLPTFLLAILLKEAPDFWSIRSVLVTLTTSKVAGPQRPIRWLHLSDMHLSCRGRGRWWQVHDDFRRSIAAEIAERGVPDLVLLTGDLSDSGDPAEFALVDELLAALSNWVGATPLVVPVPGNHDLRRPVGRALLQYRVLDMLGAGIRDPDTDLIQEELWQRRDGAFLAPLFAGYSEWLDRSVLPPLRARATSLTTSHIPGDFSTELEIGGVRLAVVGLNSAWMQYQAGDYYKRIAVVPEQLHAVLPATAGGSPLDLFARADQSLLLLHHPPDWLTPAGLRAFHSDIDLPDRFAVCLHGHLHEARSEVVAMSGGAPRYSFQAASFFGRDHHAGGERPFGYAFGEITADGTVTVWPRARVRRGSGEHVFVHDTAFPGEHATGVQIRPWQPAATTTITQPSTTALTFDWTPYLRAQLATTDHISIVGIAAAHSKTAGRHPIEQLYTPLRSRGGIGDDGDRLIGGGSVELAQVLPRHPRLLIEGEPGAGKTTFLRFVACMLARDGLGIPSPRGRSWRGHYLGLPSDTAAKLPVLVRVSELVALLEKAPLEKDGIADGAGSCATLLQVLSAPPSAPPRTEWENRFERGDVMLLLDGLDEVADPKLRARFLAVLNDACQHWTQCPMVVTSRPIDTNPVVALGFHHTVVEPFSDRQVREFINRWVAALHDVPPGEALAGPADEYRTLLLQALDDRASLRRLATNPVMLTCLCVVHWNEGQLPDGRSRAYRAVIRWLLTARSPQRKDAGYSDGFAERAFARLALAMMTGAGGKQSSIDLNDAAAAIDSEVERELPGRSAVERRTWALAWLRFESLGSGIIEELHGGRIRFWHLTFQEYLAALRLTWLGDGDSTAEGEHWWPQIEPRLADAQWRETVALFPGCLHERGQERVDLLLKRVLARRGEEPSLEIEAGVVGIMGRLLETLPAYDYRPAPEIERTYAAARQRTMAIFKLEGAAQVPVKTRIAAAEALGQGGDPRLAHDNFIPVEGHEVWLGRYPVTVEEYQPFVEQSRGYEDPRYWSDEGWAQREGDGWQGPGSWETQLATPNRPVVEVSWHEANAYCAWLSEQRGKRIRLPREAEWQAVAKPDDRKYPWGGEEPDEDRANFAANVARPTPVGVYPRGDGKYRHSDLGGNVWEWCEDRHEAGAEMRVLRGGSWSNYAVLLLAAGRDWVAASERDDGIGFRLAVAAASL